MSHFTDSLKKKVCVTVFLDELFEEVYDEDHIDSVQVSEIIESERKIADKTCTKLSQLDLDIQEKINISQNTEKKENQVSYRPRKHRKESKFSKNHYESFKNELDVYEYFSHFKRENKSREAIEFALSDSDLDVEECLELNKKLSRSTSFSEASELSEGSTLSADPLPSPTAVCRNEKKERESPINPNIRSCTIFYCNRSTQYDRSENAYQIDKKVGDDNHFEEEEEKQEKIENAKAWRKTQKQIQLILAKAKSSYQEREACEENPIIEYDLNSIIDECGKMSKNTAKDENFLNFQCLRSKTSTNFNESDPQKISDSYICVFPHNRGRNNSLEVRRVWTDNRKTVWSEGFDSELSEADCGNTAKQIDTCPVKNESLLCYTLCLRCKENIEEKKIDGGDSIGIVQSSEHTYSPNKEMSLKGVKSATSRNINRAIIKLAATSGAEATKGDEDKVKDVEEKGNWQKDMVSSTPRGDERNKNYAEGDTFEEPLRRNSKLAHNVEAKRNEPVRNEILVQVAEVNAIEKEIIVNRAEIQIAAKEDGTNFGNTVTDNLRRPQELAKSIAEVFVQTQAENAWKSMTDAESETVFAESENFSDSEDCLSGRFNIRSMTPHRTQGQSSDKEVCLVEFEDKLSRSKMLRRLKTVEFLGKGSVSDMKNISTEVILVCENISNSDVCLEAWQTSVSTLKSLTEMGQCYLKDSKDSSMYLIEIPLHFTRLKREKISDTD